MRQLFILIAAALAVVPVWAQPRVLTLTLNEAIATARRNSVDAAAALDELRPAYWEWRTYRAAQLPEVSFRATLPSYANQYSAYMNGEGGYSFVRNKSLQMNGEVTVTQNIRLTGAKLALKSSLDWVRQFDNGTANRFMSIPVALTLNQPIFGVNTMKWDSRIEPVRYREAMAAFLSATEDVAVTTVNYYFTLIMSSVNLEVAEQNLQNAEKLYAVAKEKRQMGQISGNDLLQMELNVLDAKSELTDARSTLKADMFRLRSFLDLDENVEVEPVVPSVIPNADVSYAEALERALSNNKFAQSVRRRQLQADYEVAKAKGDLREVNLFAQVGYTGADNTVGDAYSRLRGNQVVEVGVSIPLLDWGKRRGKVKVAESRRRVTESRLRKESMDFSQDLFVLVERLCNQQNQVKLAVRADEIARKRYDVNVETYLIGRISTLDLNDSQTRKDESRREYVNELFKFWNYWYQLRSVTLYDFERGGDIDADIEKLVRGF